MSEFQIGDARKPDINAMRIDCASVCVLSQCFGIILTRSPDILHYEYIMVLSQIKVDVCGRSLLAHKMPAMASICKVSAQTVGITIPKKLCALVKSA